MVISKIKQLIRNNSILNAIANQYRFNSNKNHLINEGKRNTLSFDLARLESNQIEIYGNDNKLIFEESASVRNCTIKIFGNNHTLFIGKNAVLTESLLWFEDENCIISIGENTTMQRFGHIAVTEPGKKIEIGKDCMFSFSIDIRNGDSHSIFDAESGLRINYAKDILIRDRVWLGAYTQIMGGAEIGEDSIIGIRSLVNKSIPAGVIAAGSPARVAKDKIRWSSKRVYDENYMKKE